jgi:hypothetical protein
VLVGVLLVGLVAMVSAQSFPEIVPVPDGFQPEGIATGRGTDVYVGSLGRLSSAGVFLGGGAIYKADLRTGAGSILVPQHEGRTAVGLAVDVRRNYVWAAGGPFGTAYVYDGSTGADVADVTLVSDPGAGTFVNDVVVTGDVRQRRGRDRGRGLFHGFVPAVSLPGPAGGGGRAAGSCDGRGDSAQW